MTLSDEAHGSVHGRDWRHDALALQTTDHRHGSHTHGGAGGRAPFRNPPLLRFLGEGGKTVVIVAG